MGHLCGLLVLVALVAVTTADFGTLTCNCPVAQSSFTGAVSVSSTGEPVLSTADELVSGASIGKVVRAVGLVWTQEEFNCSSTSTTPKCKCPSNFRVPTFEELSSVDLSATLAYSANRTYMSPFKAYPNVTSGSNASIFTLVWFNPVTTKFEFKNLTTSSSNTQYLRTKCVFNFTAWAPSGATFDVDGLGTRDAVTGQNYVLSVPDTTFPNALTFYYDFGTSTGLGRSTTFGPTAVGCYGMRVYAQHFGGEITSQCKKIWAIDPWGSNGAVSVADASSIQSAALSGKNVTRQGGFHFSALSSPLAPIIGGFYVVYPVAPNNTLEVAEYKNDLTFVRSFAVNNASGTTLGFTAYPGGMAILVRDQTDSNFLYLLVLRSDGSEVWRRTIMNNGVKPTVRLPDQITFYNSDGSPLFGLNITFNPSSGRIAYGRGRLGVVFAHYNYFGDGAGHTGDTVFSFNITDRTDVKLVWAWGASHSLVSRVIYDGEKFSYAALGDAYPEQIRFATFATGDYDSKDIAEKDSSSLIPGTIPGNGGGSSCGRLGDVSLITTSPTVTYGASYSRWPCSSSAKSNSLDEVGFILYSSSMTMVNQKAIGPSAALVANQKYGNSVAVISLHENGTIGSGFSRASSIDERRMEAYMTIIDFMGNVKVPKFKIPFGISGSDGMYALSDGSVAWPYVNSAKQLTIYRLPAPSSSSAGKIDCAMTQWSAWTNCQSCDTGTRNRTRTVAIDPQGGGASCPENLQSQGCDMQCASASTSFPAVVLLSLATAVAALVYIL